MVTQQRDDIKRQYDEWRKKRHDTFLFICVLYIYIFFKVVTLIHLKLF